MYIKYVKDKKETVTRYIQWGSSEKPPLLLIHGFGSIATSWIELAERLCHDYYVTAVDLPGHGNTSGLGEYSIESFNDWLESFLLHVYGNIKPIAVGHSIGAELLLNFEHLRKSGFKYLILLDGGYLSNEFDLKTSLRVNIENSLTYYHDYQFNSWSDYLVEEQKGYARWNDKIKRFSFEKMIYDGIKIKLKMDIKTVKGYITCFHENEGSSIINHINTRTLILVGTLPVQAKEIRKTAINRITNRKVKHIFVKDTTHDLYLDNPESIYIVIVDWLSEI